MSHYYLHLYDTIQTLDEAGVELSNVEEARSLAIAEVRALIAAEVRESGVINLDHWIEAEDDQGEIVFVLKFADAIVIRRGS